MKATIRMMKATMVMAAFAAAISAQGEVELSAAADRVESPLRVDMKCVGTLAPRSVKDIRSSNWTLGCETLDRDFANFDEYKRFLAPLGIKTIRLQAGWAKCEKEKGKYDFAWLDRIIDYARAEGPTTATRSTRAVAAGISQGASRHQRRDLRHGTPGWM